MQAEFVSPRRRGAWVGSDALGPCPRQDAVSGTPLLQQEEEEEDPHDEGLGTAGLHQATQAPEGKSRGVECGPREVSVGHLGAGPLGPLWASPRALSLWDRIAPGPESLSLLTACPPLPTAAANKWGLVAERLLDLSASFSSVLTRVQVFVRRLLELHVFKLVALYTVWVALKEVSVGHTSSYSAVGFLRAPHWPLDLGGPQGRELPYPPGSAPQPLLFHLPPGVSDEPLAGRALGLRPALPPLQAHGLLPVHGMDLHHHCVQDALPAQGRQPP